MQDFFCPRCGKRILNGKCDCNRLQSNSSAGKPVVRSFGQEQNMPARKAGQDGKVIPFDSVRQEDSGHTPRKKNKESIIITLIDLEQEKQKNAQKMKTKKKTGFSDRIKTGLSKFSSIVDQLVNPEEE